MVRLRTNKWYSADAQQRVRGSLSPQTAGMRRVISLCFLLALVIVLMQKASDPRHVRNAFDALGVPLERQVIASSETLSDSADQVGSGHSASEEDQLGTVDQVWNSLCSDMFPRLLEAPPNTQITEFAQAWYAVGGNLTRPDVDQLDGLRQYTDSQLELIAQQLAAAPASEHGEWPGQLARFRDQWQQVWAAIAPQSSSTPGPSTQGQLAQGQSAWGLDATFAKLLTQNLDARLAAIMRDATPWTQKETIPFLRMLQRGKSPSDLQSESAPLLSTLQLEAQPETYRGQAVRFRGQVRQVEYVPRAANAFGIEGYWSLWLRGEDGSAQPVAVYSTHPICKQLDLAIQQGQLPDVEVLGAVGKRLAYAAQVGVEVAPTLFAASILQFAPQTPLAPAAEQNLVGKFGWAALIGLLVAIAILLPILGTWRRQPLRRIGRPGGGALLLIICLLPGNAYAQPSAQAVPGETPPWVKSQESTIRSMLSQRMESVLNKTELISLVEYLAGETTNYPDGVLKLMHSLRQVGWQRSLSADAQMDAASAGLRLRVATLAGTVRLAMPVILHETQAAWFQQSAADQLYRLQVEPAQDSGDAQDNGSALQTVFCMSIPSQWMESAQLKQPVAIRGLCLSAVDESGSEAELCWFVQRPDWVCPPGSRWTEWSPRLPAYQERLGNLGWDLANLDIVQSGNQRALQPQEASAFYSLLGLLKPIPAESPEDTSPLQVLAAPAKWMGAPVHWNVRLVSGSIVQVTQPQDRRWLGAESYYQFDGFVDIGNQMVHYKISAGDQPQVVDFENEFPVTIVTRHPSTFAPPQQQGGPLNWEVGKYAQVSGVFYRLWSYESELMASKSSRARQAAPLLVAAELIPSAPIIRPATSQVGWFGYALCAAVLVILAGILFTVFQPARRTRRT